MKKLKNKASLNSVPVEETKKSIRVEANNNRDKPRFFDEEHMYCCLDNHRCNNPCRKRNTDVHGTLICSEVISEKFLPRKRRRRKKFFSREKDQEE